MIRISLKNLKIIIGKIFAILARSRRSYIMRRLSYALGYRPPRFGGLRKWGYPLPICILLEQSSEEADGLK